MVIESVAYMSKSIFTSSTLNKFCLLRVLSNVSRNKKKFLAEKNGNYCLYTYNKENFLIKTDIFGFSRKILFHEFSYLFV